MLYNSTDWDILLQLQKPFNIVPLKWHKELNDLNWFSFRIESNWNEDGLHLTEVSQSNEVKKSTSA